MQLLEISAGERECPRIVAEITRQIIRAAEPAPQPRERRVRESGKPRPQT